MISEERAKFLTGEWIKKHKKCEAIVAYRHISRTEDHWFIIIEYNKLQLVDLRVFDDGKVKEFEPMTWYRRIKLWFLMEYRYYRYDRYIE